MNNPSDENNNSNNETPKKSTKKRPVVSPAKNSPLQLSNTVKKSKNDENNDKDNNNVIQTDNTDMHSDDDANNTLLIKEEYHSDTSEISLNTETEISCQENQNESSNTTNTTRLFDIEIYELEFKAGKQIRDNRLERNKKKEELKEKFKEEINLLNGQYNELKNTTNIIFNIMSDCKRCLKNCKCSQKKHIPNEQNNLNKKTLEDNSTSVFEEQSFSNYSLWNDFPWNDFPRKEKLSEEEKEKHLKEVEFMVKREQEKDNEEIVKVQKKHIEKVVSKKKEIKLLQKELLDYKNTICEDCKNQANFSDDYIDSLLKDMEIEVNE
ncbi:hypothetical protein ABK040_009723 [Willaertia magna]